MPEFAEPGVIGEKSGQFWRLAHLRTFPFQWLTSIRASTISSTIAETNSTTVNSGGVMVLYFDSIRGKLSGAASQLLRDLICES